MEIGERLTERLTSRSVNRRLQGPIAAAVRSLVAASETVLQHHTGRGLP